MHIHGIGHDAEALRDWLQQRPSMHASAVHLVMASPDNPGGTAAAAPLPELASRDYAVVVFDDGTLMSIEVDSDREITFRLFRRPENYASQASNAVQVFRVNLRATDLRNYICEVCNQPYNATNWNCQGFVQGLLERVDADARAPDQQARNAQPPPYRDDLDLYMSRHAQHLVRRAYILHDASGNRRGGVSEQAEILAAATSDLVSTTRDQLVDTLRQLETQQSRLRAVTSGTIVVLQFRLDNGSDRYLSLQYSPDRLRWHKYGRQPRFQACEWEELTLHGRTRLLHIQELLRSLRGFRYNAIQGVHSAWFAQRVILTL